MWSAKSKSCGGVPFRGDDGPLSRWAELSHIDRLMALEKLDDAKAGLTDLLDARLFDDLDAGNRLNRALEEMESRLVSRWRRSVSTPRRESAVTPP